MLRHIIISLFRQIQKNKLSFFIKFSGLTISLGVTALVAAYIYDEFLFDSFHDDVNNLYRITTSSHFNGVADGYSRTPLPLAEMVSEMKSSASVARIFTRAATISVPDTETRFNEPNVWFADSSITKVLSFEALRGNVSTALLEPNSIILSEKAAKKYFNSIDIIGQTVLIENRIPFEVDAVVKDYPDQSTFQFEFIAPFKRFLDLEMEANVSYLESDWMYTSVFTLMRSRGESVTNISDELKQLSSQIADERVKENIVYVAQPLKKVHLFSEFQGEQAHARIIYVYVFGAIGLTLLIIAIINYVSLTSSEWMSRNKELGIRRVMGSTKGQIAFQFIAESFLFSLMIFPIAMLAAYIALPTLNSFTQKELPGIVLLSWPVLLTIALAIIAYVAFTSLFLKLQSQTNSKPVTSLSPSRFSVSLLFQCVLTLLVACFSLTIYRQLSFIKDYSLGFRKDDMITVPLFSENFNSIIGQVTGEFRGRMNYFEDEVLKEHTVEAISCSAFRPGEGTVTALVTTDSLKETDNIFISLNSVDYDFLDTYQISLVAGRNFGREFGTDHLEAFIINEEAVRMLGFGNASNALGKNVSAVGKTGKVVGVMKNFNFEGLQSMVRPLMFEVAAWKFTTFSIRVNPAQTTSAIASIEKKWRSTFPETIFQYQVMEDTLAANYRFENSLAQFTQSISYLTVIISLLGMYAASSQQSQKRLKELTMRKVLGAGSNDLVKSFVRPFAIVVGVGFVIAVPAVLYISNEWLSTFAYRTALQFKDLVLVAGVSVLLVIAVLLQQLRRVVKINPVENLRRE